MDLMTMFDAARLDCERRVKATASDRNGLLQDGMVRHRARMPRQMAIEAIGTFGAGSVLAGLVVWI